MARAEKRALKDGREIPDALPSVYDFVPSLVVQPIYKDLAENPADWVGGTTNTARTPEDLVKFFTDHYDLEKEGSSVDWRQVYPHLLILSCQGWIRERVRRGEAIDLSMDIEAFGQALTDHLKKAEQLWGVTWLTSHRDIEGQETRELSCFPNYLAQHQAGNHEQFWLDTAGDFVINLARLSTEPETYQRWQHEADLFVDQP